MLFRSLVWKTKLVRIVLLNTLRNLKDGYENMSVEVYGNYGSRGLVEILRDITSAPIVGVDTETHSIEDKTMIGLAIAPSPEYAVWFSEDSPHLHIALGILRNPNVTKLLYNSKFDFDVLEPFGIDETNFDDPMILA